MKKIMAKNQIKTTISVNDFEVLGIIGSGSYGTVKKVMRIKDKRVFVWKELDYSSASENDKQMLVSEVNLLRELKHENIVKYVDRIIDRKKSILFLIMEYCEGGDLASYIAKTKKEGQTIEENFIWKVCYQLTQAIKECHSRTKYGRSVLHRDLKPANIFLDSQLNVKLGDFGLARVLKHETSFAKTCVGTPLYMSPEQMSGIEYNEKSDMWALGCLLYELCSLRPPFVANNQIELAAKICMGKFDRIPKIYSSNLYILICSLLDVDVEKRPSIEILLQNTILVNYSQNTSIENKAQQIEIDVIKEEVFQMKNDLIIKKLELKRRERDIEIKEKDIEKRLIDIENREKNLIVIEKMIQDRMSRAEKLMQIYADVDEKSQTHVCQFNNIVKSTPKEMLYDECINNHTPTLTSGSSDMNLAGPQKRRQRLNSLGITREKHLATISPRITNICNENSYGHDYVDNSKAGLNEFNKNYSKLVCLPLRLNHHWNSPVEQWSNQNNIINDCHQTKITMKSDDRKPLKRLDKFELYKGPVKALPITSTPAVFKAPSNDKVIK